MSVVFYYYVVSDSKSDDNTKDNLFNEEVNNKVEATLQTTVNAIVVWTMKKLQASYNDNADKIVMEVTKKKDAKENMNFLIDLATIAMVAEDTKLTRDEP